MGLGRDILGSDAISLPTTKTVLLNLTVLARWIPTCKDTSSWIEADPKFPKGIDITSRPFLLIKINIIHNLSPEIGKKIINKLPQMLGAGDFVSEPYKSKVKEQN